MAFWHTYYHLVWATENRQPLITVTREKELYDYIIGKANALECVIHAIGSIENNIYLIVSIPPKLSVADFVKEIKGSSAYHLNHLPEAQYLGFSWQKGYGVFTLGSKQLDVAINYVKNQKQHHQNGTCNSMLEKYSDEKP